MADITYIRIRSGFVYLAAILDAYVSSALVGTVTGGAPSNAAITGPFTIPLMKKAGYTPVQAGAIEAAACSGAMLVPPVMGAVAFVMSDITGVPYIMICAMAVVPAILYYSCIGFYVQLNALKLGIPKTAEQVDTRLILVRGPCFIIPLIVVVVLLMQRFSVPFAAFWAIVTFVVIALLRKETRGSIKTWLQACVEGANMGAQIAVVLASGQETEGVGRDCAFARLPRPLQGWLALTPSCQGGCLIPFWCAPPGPERPAQGQPVSATV